VRGSLRVLHAMMVPLMPTVRFHLRPFPVACAAWLLAFGAVTLSAGGLAPPVEPVEQEAVPTDATGEEIFNAACITCHGPDGTGGLPSTIAFDTAPPDFTDCAFATGEADLDWYSVVHQGGTVRALDRRMPAFGDALSSNQIQSVVDYLRGFCAEPAWPRGDLNLPLAFFTEKAFPENEWVWSMAAAGGDRVAFNQQFTYEQRVGPRGQFEVKVPIEMSSPGSGSPWTRGMGDVAVGFKRVLYSSLATGGIGSAGAELILPAGDDDRGLGKGTTVFEPFAMWGHLLPSDGFIQVHGGLELPFDADRAEREGFIRASIGKSFMEDGGFGRAWSPQVEVLWAKPFDGTAEWDLVPQMQVSLSTLQHVMFAVGVRVPINERDGRSTQVLTYVLWDWFDGSPFEFWD